MDLPSALNVGLFRVLQEALQNGVKHSGANTIEVRLTASSQFIELMVKDDGRGFDPEQVINGKGLGLRGMEERVKLLGASFESTLARRTEQRFAPACPPRADIAVLSGLFVCCGAAGTLR